MNSYNGRQITQMKWKDVRELEKYLFISGDFKLQTEVLEDVLKDKLYGRIAAEMLDCFKKETRKGIIIEDTYFGGLYVGDLADDTTARLTSVDGNLVKIIDINLTNIDGDKPIGMSIEISSEELMSTDNVKTLFGTESIIGSGNIDLFTHFLTLTAADGSVLYINFPSSNKLECDSLQDLTTMTKATKTSGTKIGFGSTYIIYDSTEIWKTANNTMITKVEDKVFTI